MSSMQVHFYYKPQLVQWTVSKVQPVEYRINAQLLAGPKLIAALTREINQRRWATLEQGGNYPVDR
jgi:hypothetical protein